MSILDRIRNAIFSSADLPDMTVPDQAHKDADAAAIRAQNAAIALMAQWNPERAEDLRRINRTGNFAEGWLVPEEPRKPR